MGKPAKGRQKVVKLSFNKSIIVNLPQKSKGKNRKIYKWLRDHTSHIDFGVEWWNPKKQKHHPIHCNKNEVVKSAYRRQDWASLDRMDNSMYDDHFLENKTYFYAGNHRGKDDETLPMIDIDCQKKLKIGSLAGAIEFAEYLKTNYFPNLYYETSTNGHGVHCYVVVIKNGLDGETLNRLFRRLEHKLREILSSQNFDVEDVEIKGTLPCFEWGRNKYELLSYTSGVLAKLPRESHRFDELASTTRFNAEDLRRLPPVPNKKSDKNYIPKEGSISGKHINPDELDLLDDHYLRIAKQLRQHHVLRTSSRAVVTDDDIAIFLMLGKFFSENMNDDGSLPTDRWREMWKALYNAGDVERQFNANRYTAIRNHLSSLGYLEWEDESYVIGWTDDYGVYHKGTAAKWQFSEELIELLTLQVKGRASFVTTHSEDVIKSLSQLPVEDTITPIQIIKPAFWLISADELSELVPEYDIGTLLAA